ncbi:hypothetical protein PUN28_006055 [Cardiocondyla obscurior]|uniref:Uncharacterized protein n=1 Tax=Cardiocondyla obscurior TaxID=286306 RepID=A0AAW2GCB4_9HYME
MDVRCRSRDFTLSFYPLTRCALILIKFLGLEDYKVPLLSRDQGYDETRVIIRDSRNNTYRCDGWKSTWRRTTDAEKVRDAYTPPPFIFRGGATGNCVTARILSASFRGPISSAAGTRWTRRDAIGIKNGFGSRLSSFPRRATRASLPSFAGLEMRNAEGEARPPPFDERKT